MNSVQPAAHLALQAGNLSPSNVNGHMFYAQEQDAFSRAS